MMIIDVFVDAVGTASCCVARLVYKIVSDKYEPVPQMLCFFQES